jgi:uncharacterized protein YndB with AHSA1/START domain
MKIAAIIALCLAITVALVAVVSYMAGAQLPYPYRSKIVVTLPADEATVWAALTDRAALPQWWPAVVSVRAAKLPDGSDLVWLTDRDGRETPFRTENSVPTARLEWVIARDVAARGISWEFTLAAAPRGGTQLTLTADGPRDPSLFRCVANWFFGFDTKQKDYLVHLMKHLESAKKPSARRRRPRRSPATPSTAAAGATPAFSFST